ncbi:MAG: 2-dehydro-3-deoxygalactonokinase [Acidobacteria bacterium]|nr:2-dehydro-3-deoxygalactonokinase [Acidobacteriota bacterium]MBI3424217.1 2-dehydro-3-deoxygalactonokinase [Acidobacteriota bacterium]
MKHDTLICPLLCIDTGTTNTRVWLTQGARVLAQARAAVGVRDTARDGSPARLHEALRDLLAKVSGGQPTLRAVLAAGMITSPLGLAEVPHVAAPATLPDLIAGTQRHVFPHITDLPVWLVPGVRSGPLQCDAATIGSADVMRGEETLCLGLTALGLLPPASTLLNLGSHWKLIRLDEQSRIVASVTSLSGELIHTTQTQTILASAVPTGKPETIDEHWLQAGMREARQAGVARALFCVRLLEQRTATTAKQRMSFLLGVYLASDLDGMLRQGLLQAGQPVVLTGGGAVAAAWQGALRELAIPATQLSEDDIEQAFLTGLRQIAAGVLG